MEINREKMAKALAECNGGHCPYGCYLFNTAIKDEQMQSRNCLNIANEVIKELTEENERLGIENFDLICELSRIKEDTVREFAEKLHERFGADANRVYSNYNIHRYIDQIAKEMLED